MVLLWKGTLDVLEIDEWVVVSLAGGGTRKAEHMLTVLLPEMNSPVSPFR